MDEGRGGWTERCRKWESWEWKKKGGEKKKCEGKEEGCKGMATKRCRKWESWEWKKGGEKNKCEGMAWRMDAKGWQRGGMRKKDLPLVNWSGRRIRGCNGVAGRKGADW